MFKIFSEVYARTNYKCAERKETSIFFDDFKKEKEEFIKTLNAEQIKKFNSITWLLENHYDEIYEDYCDSAICFGFKLGMEFQEFLNTLEES